MSSPIWTPAALSSEARSFTLPVWRVVEAQHVVSTMKLVDTVGEQAILETLLEESKPSVPVECRNLHPLLYTPFRYGAPYPHGSRFRRAGYSPGVFYASETVETAVAELAFARILFFAESPATPWPSDAGEHTAFTVPTGGTALLDLTIPPLGNDRPSWTHPTDYAACQDLADRAHEADIEAIRYVSVRDPGGGSNLALLTCRAFRRNEPTGYQSWRLLLSGSGVRARREFPEAMLEFGREAFASDPRLDGFVWER